MTLHSLFNSVPDTIRRFEQISTKTKFLAFISAFLAPLYSFIIVLILFIVIDMLTSLYYQIKQRNKRCNKKNIDQVEKNQHAIKTAWRTIDPDRLPKSVEKIFAYALALIVCFIADHFVLRLAVDNDGMIAVASITNVAFVIFLVSEGISILRNLGNITGNAVFNEIIKMLTKKTNTEQLNKQV